MYNIYIYDGDKIITSVKFTSKRGCKKFHMRNYKNNHFAIVRTDTIHDTDVLLWIGKEALYI